MDEYLDKLLQLADKLADKIDQPTIIILAALFVVWFAVRGVLHIAKPPERGD